MTDTHHNHHDPRLDHCAPDCDDQIPIMASVSRGLQGNSYRVDVHDDTDGLTPAQLEEMFNDPESGKWFNFCDETFLEGSVYDEATKTWSSEWMSENINGGRLHYQYNLRPFTNPMTFTITFIYRRPGRTEWSWTTPAIPYVWSEQDPDDIVGSGVATLYLKNKDQTWTDKLIYPAGTGPADYNTPKQGEAWTVNLDIEAIANNYEWIDLDELAKVIGVTKQTIINIINNVPGALDGSDNMKDYVDDKLTSFNGHIHTDMGFGTSLIGDTPTSTIPSATLPLPKPNAGQPYTIKNYIDYRIGRLQQAIDNAEGNLETQMDNITAHLIRIDKTLADILAKFYGGGTINANTGAVTWPTTGKAAIGDLNIFANNTNPTNSTQVDALRSRDLSDDDIQVI